MFKLKNSSVKKFKNLKKFKLKGIKLGKYLFRKVLKRL